MAGSGLQHYCIRAEFYAFTRRFAAAVAGVVVGENGQRNDHQHKMLTGHTRP